MWMQTYQIPIYSPFIISTISCGLPAAERILWVWEWHEGNEIQSLKFRCLANAKFSSSANVGPTSLREKHKFFKMIFFFNCWVLKKQEACSWKKCGKLFCFFILFLTWSFSIPFFAEPYNLPYIFVLFVLIWSCIIWAAELLHLEWIMVCLYLIYFT